MQTSRLLYLEDEGIRLWSPPSKDPASVEAIFREEDKPRNRHSLPAHGEFEHTARLGS